MQKTRSWYLVIGGLLLLLLVSGNMSAAGMRGAGNQAIRHQVRAGESLWQIARNYNVNLQDLVAENQIKDINNIQSGMMLTIRQADNGTFMRPVNGGVLSSNFGRRWGKKHEGIDIAIKTGAPVRAARAGKVVWSGWVSGYGNTVILQHSNNIRTLYGHNSKLVARSGEWVKQGQIISLSGNTGRSTGPHLHFEIQINGQAVNPMNYL